jgi:O-antigen ligase
MSDSALNSSTDSLDRQVSVSALLPLFLFMVCMGICLIGAVAIFSRGSAGSVWARSPGVVLLLLVLGPIGLLTGGLMTLRWPQFPVSALVFLCVFLNNVIVDKSVSLGFFRLYPQDVLIGFALLSVLLRIPSGLGKRLHSGTLGRLIVLAMVLGLLQTVRGLALGNEFNAAFGDFRRGYFYMIAFFLVLIEASDPAGLRWVHRAFLIGAVLIAVRGVYRLTLGQLYQMSWFDVFHVLSHSDLVFIIFLAYYCFARLAYPAPGRRSWPWLLLLPLTFVLIVLGNFRASWIGFVLAGLVMAVLLPKHRRRILVLTAIPLLLIVAAGLYTFRNVRIGTYGETLQEEVVSKSRALLEWQTDPNIIWRIHSYREALRIWSEHPLLGAGLGKRLVFHSINAAGEQSIHFNHRAHNSLLWIGFTTGIVGVLLFSALHASYFLGALRRLRQLGTKPEAGVLLAYIGFYIAFIATALVDVILEISPTAIILYAHMGIVWRLCTPKGGEHEREEARP